MRVLDTDIGTDVDDLIALVTGWGSGMSFDAITTVYGDTSLRAAIVRDAYSRAGRFPPRIVAGEGRALSGRPVFWAGHEGVALIDDPEHRVPADPADAARLLAGADEILAIGPLTNVAAALRNFTGSSPAARRIVVMGGDFSGAAEHNVICDVAAADDVFSVRRAHRRRRHRPNRACAAGPQCARPSSLDSGRRAVARRDRQVPTVHGG